jgi:hypothetical protein
MKVFASLLVATTTLAGTYTNEPSVEVSTTNLFVDCTALNATAQVYLVRSVVIIGVGPPPVILSNTEAGPKIAVNPINTSNVVGIWQQDLWSNGDGATRLAAGASLDAGTTWQRVDIPGLTECSSGYFTHTYFPWVFFALDGTLNALGYVAGTLRMNKSIDGGLTWGAPVTITAPFGPSKFQRDTLTADSTDSNLVYAVWDHVKPFEDKPYLSTGPTIFARSFDGGVTWEPAREINVPGKSKQTLGNQIVVQPNGTLVNISAVASSAFRPLQSHNAIAVQRSVDHGVTWSRLTRNLKTTPRAAFATHQLEQSLEIIPAAAVDPMTGSLYIVWEDARFSHGAVCGIAFARSTDGGLHWSKPIKINQTPTGLAIGNQHAFNPSIRVAANGTICVTYCDYRNNSGVAAPLTDVWAVLCKPSVRTPANVAANWDNEVRLTDESFDFSKGDYESLATAGNDFLTFWSKPQDTGGANIFVRRLSPVP